MRFLRAALAFLTRLPMGRLEADDFARAPGWFAGAGLVIGTILAVFWLLFAALLPPTIAALLTTLAGLVLTGALHEDGLADMVDGLGSGHPKERALEIMRDSRIGSFGTLALGVAMALRVAPLAELPALVPALLIGAHTTSRALMAGLLTRGPYLRAKGAGSGMTQAWTLQEIIATLVATGIACGIAFYVLGLAVLGGLAGLILGAGLSHVWALRRLKGVTGDTLGAAQVTGEIGFLLGALAWL